MNIKKVASIICLSSTMLTNHVIATTTDSLVEESHINKPTEVMEPFSDIKKELPTLFPELAVPDTFAGNTDNIKQDVAEVKSSQKFEKQSDGKVNQRKNISRAEGKSVEVNSSDAIKKALQSADTTEIILKENISLNKIDISERQQELVIDGNGYTFTWGAGGFQIGENAKVTFQNIHLDGIYSNKNKTCFSSAKAGSITTFKESLTTSNTNSGLLFSGVDTAKCVLDGVDMDFTYIPHVVGSGVSGIIECRDFLCTNDSTVLFKGPTFIKITNLSMELVSYRIDKGSVIECQALPEGKNKEINALGVQVFYALSPNTHITITDPGTKVLATAAPINQLSNSSCMYIAGGQVKIDNQAEVLFHTKNGQKGLSSTAAASVYVSNQSKLDVYSKNQIAIEFNGASAENFVISDQSIAAIVTENDNDKNDSRMPTISFSNGQKHFNISGGATISVENKGNAKPGYFPLDRNVAILYKTENNPSVPSTFVVNGKDSNVSVTSEGGPAIYERGDVGGLLDIDVGKDSFFVVRGNTSQSTANAEPIFFSKKLSVTIDQPLYFDFKNDYNSDVKSGLVFKSKESSDFNATKTRLSLWGIDKGVNGNPMISYPQLDFKLTGKEFENVIQPNLSTFTGLKNISRINGNNQRAKVTKILPPTNADKSIYVHLAVPEGKGDADRDAFDGEAYVSAVIKDKDGNVIKDKGGKDALLKGSTQMQKIYGTGATTDGPEQMGWVKLAVPNNDWLQAGYTVEIKQAWRGAENASDAEAIVCLDEDYIQGRQTTVYDVLPPDMALLENPESISIASKSIKGIGLPGAKVLLAVNGQIVETTSVVSQNGKFELPILSPLQKEDKIQILLRKPAQQLPEEIRPKTLDTNDVRYPINDEDGNRHSMLEFLYHDLTFDAAPIYEVKEFVEAFEFEEVPKTFDFGTIEINSKKTEFWPTVDGRLIVKDSRKEKKEWQVSLQQEKLGNTNSPFANTLQYVTVGNSYPINEAKRPIITRKHTDNNDINLSDDWETNQLGIKAVIPVSKQIKGSHETTLKWSLENVPTR